MALLKVMPIYEWEKAMKHLKHPPKSVFTLMEIIIKNVFYVFVLFRGVFEE